MFNGLRRAFGPNIDDVSAEAIAFAASELYKDADPALWEHTTADEILDGLGVPRAGAFSRYSMTDRLLLLARSSGRDRRERAHAFLSDLGAPEADPSGVPLALKERVERVLDGLGPLPPVSRHAGGERLDERDEHPDSDRSPTGDVAAPGGPATTVSDEGHRQSPATTGPNVAELAGLASMIAAVQDELMRMRDAVETLRISVDEALELLHARTGAKVGAVLTTDVVQATAVLPTDAGADAPVADAAAPTAPDLAPPDTGTVAEEEPPPTPAPPVDDVTPPVEVVREPAPIPEPPAPQPRLRYLRLPVLILIAVVIGLLIAGVAIAISMVGWTELRSELSDGLGVFSTGDRAVLHEVADFLVELGHHTRGG